MNVKDEFQKNAPACHRCFADDIKEMSRLKSPPMTKKESDEILGRKLPDSAVAKRIEEMNSPMTPDKPKIKLSPSMKEGIRRMRTGNRFNTFYDIPNRWWIMDGDSYADRTMSALLKRGIIERTDISENGSLDYYGLTTLGKTIDL